MILILSEERKTVFATAILGLKCDVTCKDLTKLIEDPSVLERALTKFRIFLHHRFSSA
jgi:hypothetical protein